MMLDMDLTPGISLDVLRLFNSMVNKPERRHPMFRPGTRQRVECVVCGRDTAVRPVGEGRSVQVADGSHEWQVPPARLYRHILRDAPTVAGLFDGDWCPGSGAVVSVPNTWAPWDVARDKSGQWINVEYADVVGAISFDIDESGPVVYQHEYVSGGGPARMRAVWGYNAAPPTTGNPFKIITTT